MDEMLLHRTYKRQINMQFEVMLDNKGAHKDEPKGVHSMQVLMSVI